MKPLKPLAYMKLPKKQQPKKIIITQKIKMKTEK